MPHSRGATWASACAIQRNALAFRSGFFWKIFISLFFRKNPPQKRYFLIYLPFQGVKRFLGYPPRSILGAPLLPLNGLVQQTVQIVARSSHDLTLFVGRSRFAEKGSGAQSDQGELPKPSCLKLSGLDSRIPPWRLAPNPDSRHRPGVGAKRRNEACVHLQSVMQGIFGSSRTSTFGASCLTAGGRHGLLLVRSSETR